MTFAVLAIKCQFEPTTYYHYQFIRTALDNLAIILFNMPSLKSMKKNIHTCSYKIPTVFKHYKFMKNTELHVENS